MVKLEVPYPYEVLRSCPAGNHGEYGFILNSALAICFRSDVEGWVKETTKYRVKISLRHPPDQLNGNCYFVEFEDEQEAVLFKLWWL